MVNFQRAATVIGAVCCRALKIDPGGQFSTRGNTLYRLASKITVDGLPNVQAESLIAALNAVLVEIKAREDCRECRTRHWLRAAQM
ncbi:hypothetical protein [Solimonas sp. SE-A11]|uniref:hypothetical protein n=1 Tax=Solimonas sp. SE-A11 TaxID=3054954 RepID=UPI00259C68E9|nr:hypothetical protein [Solimonas sp. SE-A11]MDM4772579.1 hypothetical protein [Solimonas sp. SE-A11]